MVLADAIPSGASTGRAYSMNQTYRNYRRASTPPLPWGTRMKILGLAEAGTAPEEIARRLSLDLAGVARTLKWNLHRTAHQAINRGEKKQAKPSCVILSRCAGPCSACKTYVPENVHVVDTTILCENCCSICGRTKAN
jgi:hypothetical protein